MATQLDEQGLAQVAFTQASGRMKADLSPAEINLILNSIGLALNIVQDAAARAQLASLQTKLMAIRDAK
jgi:hypothetical protein